jgi:hypothetical protein
MTHLVPDWVHPQHLPRAAFALVVATLSERLTNRQSRSPTAQAVAMSVVRNFSIAIATR